MRQFEEGRKDTMRMPEEIERIRAERAAKKSQRPTALYLGVEYPEGTQLWTSPWRGVPPQPMGVIVSVNPEDRSEIAASEDDSNHRRWSNVPRGMRRRLGTGAFPSQEAAIIARRDDIIRERARLVSEIATLDAEIAALARPSDPRD
jgi:uncharacterized small protein (DUF1192 family)